MILLILVQWPEIIVTNANWNLMLIKHLISFIIVWWPEKIITYANWNLILIKYLILFFLNSFLLQKIPAMETLLLLISFEGSSEAMMIHKESGLICW